MAIEGEAGDDIILGYVEGVAWGEEDEEETGMTYPFDFKESNVEVTVAAVAGEDYQDHPVEITFGWKAGAPHGVDDAILESPGRAVQFSVANAKELIQLLQATVEKIETGESVCETCSKPIQIEDDEAAEHWFCSEACRDQFEALHPMGVASQ